MNPFPTSCLGLVCPPDGAAARRGCHQGQEAVQRHVCCQSHLRPHEGHLVRHQGGERGRTGVTLSASMLATVSGPGKLLALTQTHELCVSCDRGSSFPWVCMLLETPTASQTTSSTRSPSRSRSVRLIGRHFTLNVTVLFSFIFSGKIYFCTISTSLFSYLP